MCGIGQTHILLTLSFLFLLGSPLSIEAQKKGRVKKAKVQNVSQRSVGKLLAEYQFEEAESLLKQLLLKQSNKANDSLFQQLEIAKVGRQMLEKTEKVVFIDSIVLPYNRLLEGYKIRKNIGTLMWKGGSYSENSMSTVYVPSLNDKAFFSEKDSTGYYHLCSSYKIREDWDTPKYLNGLQLLEENQSFPFVLSDGLTLYYTADGKRNLAGKDIYVTQYNASEHYFVHPENLGMPFNSIYNDFLYVVDEENKLGWFASDRYQPKGYICIYIFIPNSLREVYNVAEISGEELRRLARINSISDTWKGHETEVKEAKERLKSLLSESASLSQENFVFVLDDSNTYHRVSDFKKEKSREKLQKWLEICLKINNNESLLAKLRDAYSKKDANSNTLLKQENDLESLYLEKEKLEKEIRNIELNK